LFKRKPRLASQPFQVPRASEIPFPDLKVMKVWAKELAKVIDRARQLSEQLLENVPQAGQELPAAELPTVVVAEAKLSGALTAHPAVSFREPGQTWVNVEHPRVWAGRAERSVHVRATAPAPCGR
jgi:hypothetical protein